MPNRWPSGARGKNGACRRELLDSPEPLCIELQRANGANATSPRPTIRLVVREGTPLEGTCQPKIVGGSPLRACFCKWLLAPRTPGASSEFHSLRSLAGAFLKLPPPS